MGGKAMNELLLRRRVAAVSSQPMMTLHWNQLVLDGDFVDSSSWTAQFSTISISDNMIYIQKTGSKTGGMAIHGSFRSAADHVYFGSLYVNELNASGVYLDFYGLSSSTGPHDCVVATSTGSATGTYKETGVRRLIIRCGAATDAVGHNCTVSKAMVVDLTDMFGAGNEPTAAEFVAMFPYDYYDYNAGEDITGYIKANGEFSVQPAHA
jgi:hypothetical protein